ncbi:MAG TPA: DUF998 domain-containing protein [Acidimicrobiales bacterium]|nr:DUF998 domain-containing protein [Acidimicrobiales bacterium]
MRLARWCPAAGVAVLAVTVAAAGALTPGYSPWRQTISSLATGGRPLALAARAALVLYGVLVAAGAGAVHGDRRCAALVRVHGAAAAVAGFVPKVRPLGTGSLASEVHVAAAVVAGAAVVAALAVTARCAGTAAERRRAALACGVGLVAAGAFPLAWGTAAYGVLERLLVAVGAGWTALPAATG